MEVIKLDLIPGKKMPSLHASQYDDGREHGIDLFENGVVYKLDGTETLTINERKGDDCICSLDIENTFADTNHIEFASTEQMCAVWGNNICELVIAKGGKTVGTLNFILEIEQSPTEGGIESESEIKNLKRQVEAITEEVIGEDYYTKTQTDNAITTAIEGKADTTYVNEELAKKADKTDTYTKTQVDTALDGKADKNTTYTKTQVDDKLSEKANADDVYTKSQTDNLLNDKADVTDLPDMSQYYDKSEVDDLLDDKANSDDVYGKAYIDTALSGKANVGTSYTKSEEDALLANKADKSDTYTKAQVDDIVYNILPDDTASGSVANFTTSLELPIKSLEVDVNAMQESGTPTPESPLPISGWSEISLTKCGKNLLNVLPLVDDDYYSLNSDGSLKVLKTDNRGWSSVSVITRLKKGTYTLSRSLASGYCDVRTSLDNFASGNVMGLSQTSKTFTLSDDADIKVKFGYGLQSGYPFDCFFNISVGSSATTYEPFNNNTEVINLGGTYYGGYFTQDKDGHRQFVVTHNYFDIGSTTWNSSVDGYTQSKVDITDMKTASSGNTKANFVCSSYKTDTPSNVYNKVENSTIAIATNQRIRVYDTRLTGMTGQQVQDALIGVYIAYEMVTPIIIDLPNGEPINTLNGTNNIYADTGDCAVEYKCSVAEYVANHSGGGGAKSLGGVFLGSSKGGSEEEPTEESEETEKTKEIDEPKEEIKTIGDEPISKK